MNALLKNILTGIGSVLVISPATAYTSCRDDTYVHRTDHEALMADIRTIAVDMQKGIERAENAQ